MKMKQIECDPVCGFMIRSHDTDEVKKIATEHVESVHKMKTSDAELESKMKTVEMKMM